MGSPATSPKPRNSLRRGLLAQFLLRTILPAAIVLVSLAALSAWTHYQNRIAVSKTVLHESAQEVANWLDVKNREGTGAATLMAGIQRGGLYGQRKATIATMRTAIEDLPHIAGISIAYEPNADRKDGAAPPAKGDAAPPAPPKPEPAPAVPQQAKAEEPPAKGDAAPAVPAKPEPAAKQEAPAPPKSAPKSGDAAAPRLVAGWFRAAGGDGTPVMRTDTGMESSASYAAMKSNWERRQQGDPIVSEPVEFEGDVIVEYGCPILAGERFYGALKIDRRLSDLRKEIEAIATGGHLDLYVVSPGGRVIAACAGTGRRFASDPAGWTARPVTELSGAATVSRLLGPSSPGTASPLRDAATGSSSFFSSATVPTGQWSVVVAVDESTVLAPIVRDVTRTGLLALAGIALITVLAYVPTKRLVVRINTAVRRAQQVASGDLTGPPSGSDLDDETGDLLRALDSMTADLNRLVGQVKGATASLSSTAAHLASGSVRQEQAVSTFGASSSEVAAALQEITATGQELSREMTHVNQIALGTVRQAQEGRARLEEMEARMKSLDDATEGVADRLGTINERAANIGGVITTISKVAEQTNLLSVNAAIEAEKAGEYGRGFLVVAREIRRLADQTGQATHDIERIVREMQAAVSSGVMEMDRFGEQVGRNVAEARDLRRDISEIIGSVEESTRSFGTVREGMDQQSIGAGQISGAMNALSVNADASTEAVRESARAAAELNRSIRMLDAAVAAFRLRS